MPQTAWRTFRQSFVTLLVILDPLGNIPLFLALTREYEPRARSRAAYITVLVAPRIMSCSSPPLPSSSSPTLSSAGFGRVWADGPAGRSAPFDGAPPEGL
jgi:hypothetical protein